MFCTNCGHELREGAKFCTNCGKSLESAAPAAPESSPAAPAGGRGGDYTPPVRQAQPTARPEEPKAQPAQVQPPQAQAPQTQPSQVQPPVCQAPPVIQQPVMVPVTENRGSPAVPIVALVMGLLAIFFFWVPFLDFVFALLATILGAVGLKKRLKGMAIAGLVIGIIFLIISIVWTIAACVGAAFLQSNPIYYDLFEDAFRSSYYYY